MAYFTAVLARTDDGYRPLDLQLEDVADLSDLTDLVDGAGDGSAEGSALAVVEHEDEWFAFIRIENGDAVVFVSDIEAAGESPYAELFADYLDSRADEYEDEEVELDDEDDSEAAEDDEDEDDDPQMLEFEQAPEWGGDPDLFAADGVGSAELLEQLGLHSSDPARVVAHVGEKAGFAEVLEAAR
ncbi:MULTISPECIES: tRNA adenosine deaminase-associated protein [Brevibacterium]|jgi:putative tRNA adenosine deaminase-associated protein|uniref:tRNA adenosine deaminase-associated protein n=1 Tax=Brevibacterium salitolerans TaxID=1403566 RepID=A0ABN2WNH3_9MICO|nr:tRNA adenosine deaminase-associated protein [Brevibacterium sp.]